ncbi:MAG: WD40 repeat domain-containing protein, partial [Planctomyces sp.]
MTASEDNTAREWDAATGASLAELTGDTEWVLSAAFSPEGTRIVTASEDGSARVWD